MLERIWKRFKTERGSPAPLELALGNDAVLLPVEHTGISIESRSVPEDVPQFKREYKFSVETSLGKYHVEVTAKTYPFGRSWSGTIRQRNYDYIIFDPRRVADKVIDRELSPVVQEGCRLILEADGMYIDNDPGQFTDTKGSVWNRTNRALTPGWKE